MCNEAWAECASYVLPRIRRNLKVAGFRRKPRQSCSFMRIESISDEINERRTCSVILVTGSTMEADNGNINSLTAQFGSKQLISRYPRNDLKILEKSTMWEASEYVYLERLDHQGRWHRTRSFGEAG